MSEGLRVVVAGLVATYPLGGVAWDYLQYVVAFHRLGAEVLYLEDTGRWVYDPTRRTFVADAADGARFARESLRRLEPALADRVAVRAADGRWHGCEGGAVRRFCQASDLLLNVSGGCWLREEYRSVRIAAYVDTDPGYTQAILLAGDDPAASPSTRFSARCIRAHDVFFTYGERLGAADCLVPTVGLRWIPTRQPILLDRWPVVEPPSGAPFTTVMSWSSGAPPVRLGGRVFGDKGEAFERVMDLPAHLPCRLEVAVSGAAPRARLAGAGWTVRDGHEVSATVDDYQRYIVESAGEIAVAKPVYAEGRTGWFSTRSAAYLAAGRPCVLDDTGWSREIPPGPGLWAFVTAADAADALAAVVRHGRAAREHARVTAEEYFDARQVCLRLLADAGLAA